jgi:hypothetical protein
MRKLLLGMLVVGCTVQKDPPPPVAPTATPPPAAPAPPPAAVAPAPAPAPVAETPTIDKAIAFGSGKSSDKTVKGKVFQLAPGTKELPTIGAAMSPFAVLYTEKWDIAPRAFTEGFPGAKPEIKELYAIRWEGKMTAKTAGVHVFKIKSKDGARLTIDGQMVVNNDGVHAPTEASGQSLLNAGDHNVIIDYFQGGTTSDIALQIWVTPPKGTAKILSTTF